MRNPPPNHEGSAAPLPLVLYRATVTTFKDASHASPVPLPEFYVFFEAPRVRHTAELESLLHHAWQVDVSTLLVTCASERELLEDFAMGPAEDGDARLFEEGYDSLHIFYCDPARTQFFVRPETQVRLQAAQQIAAHRRTNLRARRAFDVARRASDREWIQRESGARS